MLDHRAGRGFGSSASAGRAMGCRACGTNPSGRAAPEGVPNRQGPRHSRSSSRHVLVAKILRITCRFTGKSQIFRPAECRDRSLEPWQTGSAAALLVGWSRCRQGLAEQCLSPHRSCSPTTPPTPIPVLDPGRGRTKTGRFLGLCPRPTGPGAGLTRPAAVYFYSPEPSRPNVPASHLTNFKGVPSGRRLSRLRAA